MNRKTIYQKVAEVQKGIGKIVKDHTNPDYKSSYFDINTLIGKLHPLLEEKGLMLLQPIADNKVKSIIVNLDDGEQISSEIALPSLDNPQKIGSSITYYRRYTLQSLLALETEDDDGNIASTHTETAQPNATETNDKPWLNYIDYSTKETTPEWNNVIEGINKGTIGTVNEIRKYYKVSKKIEAKLQKHIELAKQQNEENLAF